MTNRPLKYNRIQCLRCLDVIESKHRHDFVWCKCGKVAVDGGLEYIRRIGEDYNELAEWFDAEEIHKEIS